MLEQLVMLPQKKIAAVAVVAADAYSLLRSAAEVGYQGISQPEFQPMSLAGLAVSATFGFLAVRQLCLRKRLQTHIEKYGMNERLVKIFAGNPVDRLIFYSTAEKYGLGDVARTLLVKQPMDCTILA